MFLCCCVKKFANAFMSEYLRIDCYFRAHMEYKRPDGGLKIP